MTDTESRPRVVTATLNAALDITLTVDALEIGDKQGARGEQPQAGGKGINVARGLQAEGIEPLAWVVVGGPTGERILEGLAEDGLNSMALEAPGDSRTCLEIVEPDGRATQLHGVGVDGGGDLAARLLSAVASLPETTSWFALCGSLPPGLAPGTTRQLLETARAQGLKTAVDIRGPALIEAVRAAPDLLRINEAEFRELGSAPLDSWVDADAERPALTIVSRGASPFGAARRHGPRWRITPPKLDAVNAIGCGDAMLAGWLAAMLGGASDEDALRRGTALAAAEALSPVAGRPDAKRARDLAGDVSIERR